MTNQHPIHNDHLMKVHIDSSRRTATLHDTHRHPNAEETEYLVEGHGDST